MKNTLIIAFFFFVLKIHFSFGQNTVSTVISMDDYVCTEFKSQNTDETNFYDILLNDNISPTIEEDYDTYQQLSFKLISPTSEQQTFASNASNDRVPRSETSLSISHFKYITDYSSAPFPSIYSIDTLVIGILQDNVSSLGFLDTTTLFVSYHPACQQGWNSGNKPSCSETPSTEWTTPTGLTTTSGLIDLKDYLKQEEIVSITPSNTSERVTNNETLENGGWKFSERNAPNEHELTLDLGTTLKQGDSISITWGRTLSNNPQAQLAFETTNGSNYEDYNLNSYNLQTTDTSRVSTLIIAEYDLSSIKFKVSQQDRAYILYKVEYTTPAGDASGKWSGNGITENGIFNPASVTGDVEITYSIDRTVCEDLTTNTINITGSNTSNNLETFNDSLCLGTETKINTKPIENDRLNSENLKNSDIANITFTQGGHGTVSNIGNSANLRYERTDFTNTITNDSFTYKVTLADGTFSESTVFIHFNQATVPTSIEEINYCANNLSNINLPAITNGTWYINSSAVISFSPSNQNNNDTLLLVQNNEFCFDSASILLEITPEPDVHVSTYPELCSYSMNLNLNEKLSNTDYVVKWFLNDIEISGNTLTIDETQTNDVLKYEVLNIELDNCNKTGSEVLYIQSPINSDTITYNVLSVDTVFNLPENAFITHSSNSVEISSDNSVEITGLPYSIETFTSVSLNGFSCENQTIYNFTFTPILTLDVGEDIKKSSTEAVPLIATVPSIGNGVWTYTSSNGGELSFTDYNNPNTDFTVDKSDTYIITWSHTLPDGVIISDSLTAEILVLVIPEGFSPNGDGINDYFEIVGLNNEDKVSLTIMNRWGQVIFKDFNYKNTWNGELRGDPLPNDSYLYNLKSEKIGEQTGLIILKR